LLFTRSLFACLVGWLLVCLLRVCWFVGLFGWLVVVGVGVGGVACSLLFVVCCLVGFDVVVCSCVLLFVVLCLLSFVGCC